MPVPRPLRAPVVALVLATACSGGGTGTHGPHSRAATGPDDGDGVRPVRFPQARRHWPERGYVEMVPPVRLPTTHDRRDLIRIWYRLPQGARIGVRWLEAQQRHTVEAPAGTRAERVEYIRYRTDGGWAPTVIDVRGWEVGRHGPARFRVARPTGGAPLDPLRGWSWPAGNEGAQACANARLRRFVSTHRRPIDRPPLSGNGVDHFIRLNECGTCHLPNKPTDPTADRERIPRRPTDANGCYVLLMMLEREVPLSEARPLDLNVKDPYVRIRCDGHVVDFPEGDTDPDCPDGSTPMAFRDIQHGLAEEDGYTRRVCEARRYIHRHMPDAGRRAFAEAFHECGLPVPELPR